MNILKFFLKTLLSRFGFEIRRKGIIEAFYQVDPFFNQIYDEAQKKTQMEETDNRLRRERHYVLNYLIKSAELEKGDVCEAGCWRGLSAYQIASHIKSCQIDVPFHLFDSFEGLSEIQDVDRYEKDGRDPQHIMQQFACPLSQVQDNLKAFNFIRYYPGWIPNRYPEVSDVAFSFVHIDVDLYQPIRDSFLFFYPRLVSGGIMVFDDYGCIQFPGAKKAVDECLSEYGQPFFLPMPSGQAFLIKD
jgi:hypothetical protein